MMTGDHDGDLPGTVAVLTGEGPTLLHAVEGLDGPNLAELISDGFHLEEAPRSTEGLPRNPHELQADLEMLGGGLEKRVVERHRRSMAMTLLEECSPGFLADLEERLQERVKQLSGKRSEIEGKIRFCRNRTEESTLRQRMRNVAAFINELKAVLSRIKELLREQPALPAAA